MLTKMKVTFADQCYDLRALFKSFLNITYFFQVRLREENCDYFDNTFEMKIRAHKHDEAV